MTWRITSPCYRLKSKSFQTQLFLSAIFLSPRSTSRAKSALLSCTAIISVAIWSKRETVSQICRTWFPSLSHIQASFQRVRLASRWDGKEAITEQSQAQLDYRSKYLQPRWTLQVFSFFWRKLRLLVLLILLGCPSFYQTSFSAVFGLFEREREPFRFWCNLQSGRGGKSLCSAQVSFLGDSNWLWLSLYFSSTTRRAFVY